MRATVSGTPYTVFGYDGKQVRDNIHAHDVVSAFEAFHAAPRVAAVYNLGGGRVQQLLDARGDRTLPGDLWQDAQLHAVGRRLGSATTAGGSPTSTASADYPEWQHEYDLGQRSRDPRPQCRALARRGVAAPNVPKGSDHRRCWLRGRQRRTGVCGAPPWVADRALDNLKRRGSELNLPRLREAGVSFVHGDVRQFADLDGVGEFDAIVECSAEPSVLAGVDGAPDYLCQSNLLGAYHCLEAAARGALRSCSSRPAASIRCAAETLNLEETETRFELSRVAADRGRLARGQRGIPAGGRPHALRHDEALGRDADRGVPRQLTVCAPSSTAAG